MVLLCQGAKIIPTDYRSLGNCVSNDCEQEEIIRIRECGIQAVRANRIPLGDCAKRVISTSTSAFEREHPLKDIPTISEDELTIACNNFWLLIKERLVSYRS